MLNKAIKKIPWGIIAGSTAVFVFFATLGFIVLYVVDSGVAAQTSESVSMFETWYQVLLFVADIIAAIVCVGSLALWILRKTGKLGKEEAE